MQARRQKGLCYNCDEKFSPGHRCKVQLVCLLETLIDEDTKLGETKVNKMGKGL